MEPYALVSRFNSILGGKTLVVFEELENFGPSEWMAVNQRLKRWITSNKIQLQPKGVDAFKARNYNNYVVITNNDALKDDNCRRIFMLDVSSCRLGDRAYWKNLAKTCCNDNVGSAFFSYLMEADTKDFIPQDFPLTENKKDSFVKRLDKVHEFLKDQYVLQNRDLEGSVGDIYEAFANWAYQTKVSKVDFNKKLKDLNIFYFKSDKVNKYRVSHAELLTLANTLHWNRLTLQIQLPIQIG